MSKGNLTLVRPLGVSEAERRRAEGGGTGKLPLGVAASPSAVAPSSASNLAARVTQLEAEVAHLTLCVEMAAEILLRHAAKLNQMTGAAS